MKIYKIFQKTIILLYTLNQIKGDQINPDSIIYFENDKNMQNGISIKNILLAD